MTSNIDATKPVGPVAYTADVRDNFATAAFEIGALQDAVAAINAVPSLPIAGGVLTGPLTLAADPVAPLDAATKQYVDAAIAAAMTTLTRRAP